MVGRKPSKPRSEARRLWDEAVDPSNFVPVFVLTLLLLAIGPLLSETTWGPAVTGLYTIGLIILALRASQIGPRLQRFTRAVVALASLALVAVFLVHLGDGVTRPVLIAVGAFTGAALYAVTIPAILARTLTSHRVTFGDVAGVVTAYLMVGLLFASAYRGVDAVTGTFFAQSDIQPSDWPYFSFITLATVGYGDLTPEGQLPQTLAMLEGILGQVFLVTIVARFVTNLGAERDPALTRELAKRRARFNEAAVDDAADPTDRDADR
jgi:hypothetical protein